ncbi:hypothetical protein ACP70R_049041 [Stipagrostis hirtigluma subsp. patula]
MALACTARLIHTYVVSKNPRAPPLLFQAHRAPVTAVTSSQHFALHSVDVSKDDKPLEAPASERKEEAALAGDGFAPLPEEGAAEADGPKLDPRRLAEKFAVLNTGVYECRSCGYRTYRYDQAAGDPSYPVPPGLPFAQLPDDWRCPTCGAAQSFFESKSVEIAGFAENQQLGLGGNSLTAGQKGLLIYGSLLVGFLFFLSGYFLQ